MKVKSIIKWVLISVSLLLNLLVILLCVGFYLEHRRPRIEPTNSKYLAEHVARIVNRKEPPLMPKAGVLPDEKTALEVGLKILARRYSSLRVALQKPFRAFLVDGYWVISGSTPENQYGGGLEIILSQKDGRVVSIQIMQ